MRMAIVLVSIGVTACAHEGPGGASVPDAAIADATAPPVDAPASADAASGLDAAPCADGPRPPKPAGLMTWIAGDPADACVSPTPGLLLMGGGADVDAAFANRIKPRLAGGDIVVLRTTGTDAYDDYLRGLTGADSVETILVTTRDQAGSDYVAWAIDTAEMIWFAGGDQADYLNQWKGTRVVDAVAHARARGALVGGTSAGLAILGDVIYDPDGVTATISSEAVLDPCGDAMKFADQFLGLAPLAGMILEPHFHQRDRMGRLLAFMARVGGPAALAPHRHPITGIAIDEATSLFVDASGHGVVDGGGAVYVLREDASTTRTTVACGEPIVYGGVARSKLVAGDTIDLGSTQPAGTTITVGIDGRNSSFYSPADPY
jgi:cyanophycinase